MNPFRVGWLTLGLVFVCCTLSGAPPVLRQAAAVLALPSARAAQGIPVDLTGVVTAAPPGWKGKCFVQDGTAGIFILRSGAEPKIGDLVHVQGVTARGDFAPVVRAQRWDRLGSAPLPAAAAVPIDRLMAGSADGLRVQLECLVRDIYRNSGGRIVAAVTAGAYRLRVLAVVKGAAPLQNLVGARVRVRGTVSTSFNALRQLTHVNIYVPAADDFLVEEREKPPPPFSRPVEALADVARFRPDASLSDRRHVIGVVSFQRPGEGLYLQDASGGLKVTSRQADHFAPGQVVEAVGFVQLENYEPVLDDALCRPFAGAFPPIRPAAVTFSELNSGRHRNELVALSGRLMNRSVDPFRPKPADSAGRRTLLTLASGGVVFTAECEEDPSGASPIDAIALGSVVRVTGVATFVTGENGRPESVKLLLPTASSISVLERPSWFTPERLVLCLVAACAALAGAAGWTVTVSRKNTLLRTAMADRENAQRALLSERTRLATDLHDTLEQAMTGIGLQLEAASRLIHRDVAEAAGRLDLAKGFLKESQLEVRRSIWDLRSRELEQFDLAEALDRSAEQIAAASGLEVELEIVGERKRLPEVVEENLLRIGQEALTNVVKHSGATRVAIRLEMRSEEVILEVKDNGRGFDTAEPEGRRARGFGLLGMSERAKRVSGRVTVAGGPGEGATIRVAIRLATPAA